MKKVCCVDWLLVSKLGVDDLANELSQCKMQCEALAVYGTAR